MASADQNPLLGRRDSFAALAREHLEGPDSDEDTEASPSAAVHPDLVHFQNLLREEPDPQSPTYRSALAGRVAAASQGPVLPLLAAPPRPRKGPAVVVELPPFRAPAPPAPLPLQPVMPPRAPGTVVRGVDPGETGARGPRFLGDDGPEPEPPRAARAAAAGPGPQGPRVL